QRAGEPCRLERAEQSALDLEVVVDEAEGLVVLAQLRQPRLQQRQAAFTRDGLDRHVAEAEHVRVKTQRRPIQHLDDVLIWFGELDRIVAADGPAVGKLDTEVTVGHECGCAVLADEWVEYARVATDAFHLGARAVGAIHDRNPLVRQRSQARRGLRGLGTLAGEESIDVVENYRGAWSSCHSIGTRTNPPYRPAAPRPIGSGGYFRMEESADTPDTGGSDIT